jgi:YidB-like protein
VLGSGTVADLAKKAGIGEAETTSTLASLLPQVIDKISPGGKVPRRTISAARSHRSASCSADRHSACQVAKLLLAVCEGEIGRARFLYAVRR